MCGIVGYVGPRKVVPTLVSALKRVEYRGYDSAGIAVRNDSGLVVCKKTGQVTVLEQQLASQNLLDLPATVGIAHTRWATHGVPNDKNAHPHLSCRKHIAVVHNGVIENFHDLQRMLVERGHKKIRSDTDSELLAHLIGECLNGDPVEAVSSALTQVEGTYGLAVIFRDHPGVVVFARKGSPLCIGVGKGEYFVASDAASFREFTDQQIILKDGMMGFITANQYEVMNSDKVPLSPKIETIEWKLEQIAKGGHDHYMLKEICEQPESLQRSIGGRLDDGQVKLGGLEDHHELIKGIENIFFVASGTSLYAGMIGKILIQEICKMYSAWENASELANQQYPFFPTNSGVWAISQSGETADLLFAIKRVKELALPVLGICNVVGSSIARETAAGVYIHAGPEIGVASTKAFTSQVLVLNLIALFLHQLRGLERWPWMDKYIANLKAIPSKVAQIIECREKIAKVAKKYAGFKNFLFLGRGINYPVALEGALKLKEISYLHAEGYPTSEMKHGPLALIDANFPTIVIAPQQDEYYKKTISNIRELTARKGPVIAIANEGDNEIAEYVSDVIYVPRTTYYLMPLLSVVPLQLFAYYVAKELGCKIDQPRNLAKSVTVE